jgi:hypothetical protein
LGVPGFTTVCVDAVNERQGRCRPSNDLATTVCSTLDFDVIDLNRYVVNIKLIKLNRYIINAHFSSNTNENDLIECILLQFWKTENPRCWSTHWKLLLGLTTHHKELTFNSHNGNSIIDFCFAKIYNEKYNKIDNEMYQQSTN